MCSKPPGQEHEARRPSGADAQRCWPQGGEPGGAREARISQRPGPLRSTGFDGFGAEKIPPPTAETWPPGPALHLGGLVSQTLPVPSLDRAWSQVLAGVCVGGMIMCVYLGGDYVCWGVIVCVCVSG